MGSLKILKNLLEHSTGLCTLKFEYSSASPPYSI